MRHVVATAAEIGGVDESGASGIYPRHKSVGGPTTEDGLECPGCCREGRGRITRYVSTSRGIHRNALAHVIATAAEVGGVNQPRPRGVQLRHESVAGTTAEGGLECPGCRRKGRGRI